MLRRLRIPLLSLLTLLLLAGCSNPAPALMQRFGLRIVELMGTEPDAGPAPAPAPKKAAKGDAA